MMDRNIYKEGLKFRGARAELLQAIRTCAKPPVFIPVRGAHGENTNRVVIEFDVHPTSATCRGLVFYALNKKLDK